MTAFLSYLNQCSYLPASLWGKGERVFEASKKKKRAPAPGTRDHVNKSGEDAQRLLQSAPPLALRLWLLPAFNARPALLAAPTKRLLLQGDATLSPGRAGSFPQRSAGSPCNPPAMKTILAAYSGVLRGTPPTPPPPHFTRLLGEIQKTN